MGLDIMLKKITKVKSAQHNQELIDKAREPHSNHHFMDIEYLLKYDVNRKFIRNYGHLFSMNNERYINLDLVLKDKGNVPSDELNNWINTGCSFNDEFYTYDFDNKLISKSKKIKLTSEEYENYLYVHSEWGFWYEEVKYVQRKQLEPGLSKLFGKQIPDFLDVGGIVILTESEDIEYAKSLSTGEELKKLRKLKTNEFLLFSF